MAASKSAVKKNAAPASVSRDDADFDALVAASRSAAAALPRLPDAYFDALSAATERRQQHESPEKRLERANQEQYRRHAIGEDRKERKRTKSANANLRNTKRIEDRHKKISDLWPMACEAHPRNPGKRYDWILNRLEVDGFRTISHFTLVSRDLPKLRKAGRLISR